MKTRKEWKSQWQATLTPRLNAHWRWYDRGRLGEGRIVMVGEQLQGATVRGLEGARFESCDFSGANMNLMDACELVECTFDEALLNDSTWETARLERCRFHGAWMGFGRFTGATLDGVDFLGSFLERTDWNGAIVRETSFRSTRLIDARFDGATFVDCDFTNAELSRRELEGDMARCPRTTFVRCSFQGANLDGLRLDETVFDNCQFLGMMGKPDLEGACTLIAPDYSMRGDGAPTRSGVPGIREPEDVLRVWRELDAAEILQWGFNMDKTPFDRSRHYPERKKS